MRPAADRHRCAGAIRQIREWKASRRASGWTSCEPLRELRTASRERREGKGSGLAASSAEDFLKIVHQKWRRSPPAPKNLRKSLQSPRTTGAAIATVRRLIVLVAARL